MRNYKEELSSTQYKIYMYLKDFTLNHGYAPSVRDICKAVGLTSTSTVHGHLTRLDKKGLIERRKDMSRAITVVDEDRLARKQSLAVPLVDNISTSIPVYTEEHIVTFLPIPKHIVPDEDSFAFKVMDESMISSEISKGDILVVKEQNYAFDEDVVVAVVGDKEKSILVKTFYLDGRNVQLLEKSSDNNPIILPRNQVQVLGKVTALIRRM